MTVRAEVHKGISQKKKRGRKKTYLAVLIILVGLTIMLIPTLSNFIYRLDARGANIDYEKEVSSLSPEAIDTLLAAAQRFNESLTGEAFPYTPGEALPYEVQLNVGGMMGRIVIPKLGEDLPIYHGTSEAVLQKGIGHLEGSSLPSGGAGNHAVLSGHRGITKAKLFTHLDRLTLGDQFSVRILGKELTYEVDQIAVIEPGDNQYFARIPDKDYLTLMTCTPYGVNTHRLLVRGVRVEGSLGAKTEIDLTSLLLTRVLPLGSVFLLLSLLLAPLVKMIQRRGK